MSSGRSIVLQQFYNANHQQNRRPRPIEAGDIKALEEKKNADGHHHRGAGYFAHTAAFARAVTGAALARTAAITRAVRRMRSDHAPLFGEHPSSEKDQEYWPKTVHAEFPDVHGVQQEEHAQADQNDRDGRNTFGFASLAHAEGLRQSEWIRCGLALLKGAGGADGVDDLIDVEESNGDAEQRVPASSVV